MHAASQTEFDALLFDLGGVLLEVDFQRAFASWAAAARVPIETVASRFRADAAYAAHERGNISAADYFASLRRTLAIELSDEQFLAGWNAIIVGEIAGVRELLAAAAHRWPLHLFSNTSEAHRHHWLPRHGALLQPFAKVFLSCEIGLRKPDVEAYAHVAQRIGLPPGRIAFFDDTAENVTGARRAGMHAFRVRSPADIAAALGLNR